MALPSPFTTPAPLPSQPTNLPWIQAEGSGSGCASSPGSHWLQSFDTVTYGPDTWEPRFIHVCYVDATQVMGFDSNAATAKMEPRAPWMKQEPPEYWKEETQEALYKSQGDRKFLEVLMNYYKHSKGGEWSQITTPPCPQGPAQFAPLQVPRPEVKPQTMTQLEG